MMAVPLLLKRAAASVVTQQQGAVHSCQGDAGELGRLILRFILRPSPF